MTPADVARLRALLAKRAGCGPWHVSGKHIVDEDTPETAGIIATVRCLPYEDDVALICAAVNALPALLDELERAREVLRECESVEHRHYVTSHVQWIECASCGAERDPGEPPKHHDDCELKAVLAT